MDYALSIDFCAENSTAPASSAPNPPPTLPTTSNAPAVTSNEAANASGLPVLPAVAKVRYGRLFNPAARVATEQLFWSGQIAVADVYRELSHPAQEQHEEDGQIEDARAGRASSSSSSGSASAASAAAAAAGVGRGERVVVPPAVDEEVVYYPTFCYDRVGVAQLAGDAAPFYQLSETGLVVVPYYDRPVNVVPLAREAAEETDDRRGQTCFNCGSKEHGVHDCPHPRDEQVVRTNQAAWRASSRSTGGKRSTWRGRYHEAGADEGNGREQQRKRGEVDDRGESDRPHKRYHAAPPPPRYPPPRAPHHHPPQQHYQQYAPPPPGYHPHHPHYQHHRRT